MSAPQLLHLTVDLAAVTSTATYYAGLAVPNGEWVLDAAQLLPTGAFAADTSNFYVIAIKQGSDTIGSITLATQTLVAGTGVVFSLTKDSNAEFGSTDGVTITVTETGTATMVISYVNMVFRKIRS